MVGGGNRRDEGSLVIKNTNVFAALETLRRKKKSDKKSKGTSKEPKAPAPVWPGPLNSKSWADVEDEDDDELWRQPPVLPAWGTFETQPIKHKAANVEESEGEEDILDEGDEDEEEHDHEPEAPVQTEPVVKKPAEVVPAPPKEAEKQLSKKEKKKKELAELDALLADLGVNQKGSDSQDESRGVAQEKDSAPNGHVEKKENQPGESKSSKKKKKKDKASKDAKESQDQPNNTGVSNGPSEVAGTEHTEEDTLTIDVKERLKKVAAAKKKKGKELDAAAKAAAQEAAARRAKLAAAKKKEKNHYNQQPVR